MADWKDLIPSRPQHPSIIAWGIANEEISVQDTMKADENVAEPMQEIMHRLDPTRPATFAMNWDWGDGFSKVMDVQGFNYWSSKCATAKNHRGSSGHGRISQPNIPTQPERRLRRRPAPSARAAFMKTTKCTVTSALMTAIARGGDAQREWGSTAEAWMELFCRPPVARRRLRVDGI